MDFAFLTWQVPKSHQRLKLLIEKINWSWKRIFWLNHEKWSHFHPLINYLAHSDNSFSLCSFHTVFLLSSNDHTQIKNKWKTVKIVDKLYCLTFALWIAYSKTLIISAFLIYETWRFERSYFYSFNIINFIRYLLF